MATGVAVIAIGVLLVTVGVGPGAERLRLVQTGWGVGVIAGGVLAVARRRPAAVRTILAGLITGSFAVGVADARGRPLTDDDLLLPLLLGICFLGVEIAGLLGAPGASPAPGEAGPGAPPRP